MLQLYAYCYTTRGILLVHGSIIYSGINAVKPIRVGIGVVVHADEFCQISRRHDINRYEVGGSDIENSHRKTATSCSPRRDLVPVVGLEPTLPEGT